MLGRRLNQCGIDYSFAAIQDELLQAERELDAALRGRAPRPRPRSAEPSTCVPWEHSPQPYKRASAYYSTRPATAKLRQGGSPTVLGRCHTGPLLGLGRSAAAAPFIASPLRAPAGGLVVYKLVAVRQHAPGERTYYSLYDNSITYRLGHTALDTRGGLGLFCSLSPEEALAAGAALPPSARGGTPRALAVLRCLAHGAGCQSEWGLCFESITPIAEALGPLDGAEAAPSPSGLPERHSSRSGWLSPQVRTSLLWAEPKRRLKWAKGT